MTREEIDLAPKLRCTSCSKLWSMDVAEIGDRCGVRLASDRWCSGLLEEHGCGGPKEACCIPGCDECGTPETAKCVMTREEIAELQRKASEVPGLSATLDEARTMSAERDLETIARELLVYANNWEPGAMLLGNLSAREVARLAASFDHDPKLEELKRALWAADDALELELGRLTRREAPTRDHYDDACMHVRDAERDVVKHLREQRPKGER